MLETKKFKYQMEVEGVTYTPSNIEILFGEEGHYVGLPEDAFVTEEVGDLFQDALTNAYSNLLDFMASQKLQSDQSLWTPFQVSYVNRCKEKIDRYQALRDSFRLVKE